MYPYRSFYTLNRYGLKNSGVLVIDYSNSSSAEWIIMDHQEEDLCSTQ